MSFEYPSNIFNQETANNLISEDQAKEIIAYITNNPHSDVSYSGADLGIFDKIPNYMDFFNGLKYENAFNGLSPETQDLMRNQENMQNIIDSIHAYGLDDGYFEDIVTQEVAKNSTEIISPIVDNAINSDLPSNVAREVSNSINMEEIIQLFPEVAELIKDWGPLLVTAFLGSSILILEYLRRRRLKDSSILAQTGTGDSNESLDYNNNEGNEKECFGIDCYEKIVTALHEVVNKLDNVNERGVIFDDLAYPANPVAYHQFVKTRPSYMSLPTYREYADSRNFAVKGLDIREVSNCEVIDHSVDYMKGISKLFESLNIDTGIRDNYISLGGKDYSVMWLLALEMDRIKKEYCERNPKYGTADSLKKMLTGYLVEIKSSSDQSNAERICRNLVDTIPFYDEKNKENGNIRKYDQFTDEEKKSFKDLVYIIDSVLLISYADKVNDLSDSEVKEVLSY